MLRGMQPVLRYGFLLLALGSLALAQNFSIAGCAQGSPEPVCLRPEVVLRWGLNQVNGSPAEGRLSFGVKLGVYTAFPEFALELQPALWVDSTLQADLLEAAASTEFGPLWLSLGKRTDYSGPWSQTLMGYNGDWGLFARYRLLEGWRAEAAYLPRSGLAGGRGFLGIQAGWVRAGGFLEVGEVGAALIPRIGVAWGDGDLYWQLDQGFWSDLQGPLPLGQALAYSLRCPQEGNALCWGRLLPEENDPTVQNLLQTLDTGRWGLLLWWNPDWNLWGSLDPVTGDTLPFLDWLAQPKKLLLQLSAGLQSGGLGFDLSLAPVGAYRVYLELHLP